MSLSIIFIQYLAVKAITRTQITSGDQQKVCFFILKPTGISFFLVLDQFGRNRSLLLTSLFQLPVSRYCYKFPTKEATVLGFPLEAVLVCPCHFIHRQRCDVLPLPVSVRLRAIGRLQAASA